MSRKYHFRGCFDKQYGKRAQKLLKSVWQHLYHINWSLARKLCSKEPLLLTCQIWGLLVNIVTADEKCPVLKRDNLRIPIQIQLSEKIFFSTFCRILKIFIKFWTSWIKRWQSQLLWFRNYGLKTWFDKCLKSLVSEDPFKSKMGKVPKHCSNLHQSTLITFIDDSKGNWFGKSLSYWHAKSWVCLLTHWLPMKSILFCIGTI